MFFDELANELIIQIYLSLSSVSDVVSLSRTCRHFHAIFNSSSRLPILTQAAENEHGPLHDSIQLLTYNASQPAHIPRSVPISLALITQILHVGRVANKWADIYPLKKWRADFTARRLLTNSERYKLRRAIYRLWLYARAFHNRQYPRTTRLLRAVLHERSELLHNWSTPELGEIEDVRLVIREVLQNHICPSNGTIQRKFRKRFPDTEHQLLFNIHLNYPPPPNETGFTHHPFLPPSHTSIASKYAYNARHDPGNEGWGDEIPHYYLVEDMLKLDPGQILWLREHAPLKEHVKAFLKDVVGGGGTSSWSVGGEGGGDWGSSRGWNTQGWAGNDWFENNGETFGQTLEWVLDERGENVGEIREAVEMGESGVVVEEE
jgi:hypothetical protein